MQETRVIYVMELVPRRGEFQVLPSGQSGFGRVLLQNNEKYGRSPKSLYKVITTLLGVKRTIGQENRLAGHLTCPAK